MGSGLSMSSRAEITAKFAKGYVKASKADKGKILDQVVQVTGWSRDNARRRLRVAARPPGAGRQVAERPRRQRRPRYSYDALKVLQKVWAASGGQCGKYLAASMALQLAGLERHGELVFGRDRYSPEVRGELLAMSGATIDRYLRPVKAKDQIKGKSTTKASPLLRSSIKIRKATDEVETAPGFFEGDTVAHCGASKTAIHEIPYEVTGLDFDNGTEFLNKAVIGWAAQMEIFFTRSRPYKKNDQATIESKNNHLVRKYGFYYRYDTDAERAVLNRLWKLVNDRLNYLTPTIKPIGYGCGRDGRRRRLYDQPTTPLDRLLAAGVLSPAQESELLAYRDSLNPAAIARQIADLQARLLVLAKEKTEQLYLAAIPTALPDIHKGIRTKAS